MATPVNQSQQPTPIQGMRGTSAQDTVVDRPRRRGWYLGGLIVLALLVWGGWETASTWFNTDHSVAGDRLRIAEVTRGEFVRDIPIQGEVVAAIKPTLFAPSAGRVNLVAAAGDVVTEGDVLAVIDSPELQNELQQAEALLSAQRTTTERETIAGRQQDLQNQQAVDLARVEVTAAERELRRAEASWEYQVISLQDLEQAQDNLERARLEFAHRQADAALYRERFEFEQQAAALEVQQQALRVEELQRQIAALTVVAPVTGIVGTVSVQNRAAVTADAPLINVIDLSRLEIEVPLPQGYADDVLVGMTATVRYEDGVYSALVASISPEVENNTVATRLRFAEQQPEGLRQNQRLTGRIELDRLAQATQVARGAWFDSDAGRAAYVIDGDYAVRRRISTGATSAQSIQILEGLSVGERVVVSNTADFEGQERILIID